jgi:small-conductance mechanosensitive channel
MKRTIHTIAIMFTLLILALSGAESIAQEEVVVGDQSSDSSSLIIEDVRGEVRDTAGSIIDNQEWSVTMEKVFWSVFLFVLVWLGMKYLSRFLQRFGEKQGRYRLLVKRFIPVIRIILWSLVIYFIIANIIAPPWATLVTLLASAGIAIGIASQDILKNIFGGLMILFDRPFQVGDKIGVDKYYGEVIDIGLRTVRIVTPDDSTVTVPNHLIVNSSVSNANSGESNCQVVAEFYLFPDTDLQLAREIARKAASVSRYIYLDKPITVIFKGESEMGQNRIKMRLKAYVLDLRYEFKFLSEMTEIVVREFSSRGIPLSRAAQSETSNS